MPKYYLDIPVTSVHGHQTFSVTTRSLKSAKAKFKARESMEFETEELDVEDLEEIDDSLLKGVYQE